MEFGKIQPVSIREIWQGEATHFTPWLSENLSVLSEKIGMDLELITVEGDVGDFSADIVARDLNTNRTVVIENQFGSTDHKHLGQIITYSSVLGAGVVVWIAETIRAEHKSAIDFLNHNLKESLQIYALEVSVIKIDDSKPAYVFNSICMPTESTLMGTDSPKRISETGEKYRAFFQMLIDELRTQHKYTNARLGQPLNFYVFPSENSKIYEYCASFAQGKRARVEVYIDYGDKAKNKALFDVLHASREKINAEYGVDLSWERLDSKRGCRIAVYRDGEINADSAALQEIKTWFIQNLLEFKRIFPKHINAAITASAIDIV